MNAAGFRAAMAALPEPPANSAPPHWNYWRNQLWHLAQSDDVSNFMAWQPIYATMLVNHFPIGAQLAYLQTDWARWGPVVADEGCEANQRNLINQAYHLKLWEDTTGKRVGDLRSIVEFGGGYGALALVARRAGFTGWYTIQDLPEFALLQRWWLASQGVEKVIYASGPAAIEEADLFIGIYSISEVAPADRSRWIVPANSYLLLYSAAFADYDNVEWAENTMYERDILDWRVLPFPGRPDFYAIGWQL